MMSSTSDVSAPASELAAGAGSSGSVGEATVYQFEARKLVDHAVRWIEQTDW
jgi:hypothetical protein